MHSFLTRGKLTTLLFHKVPRVKHPLNPSELSLDDFSTILKAAKRRYRILPLEEALTALRAGNLPANSACITFDDGYPDWRNGVLPVLERENVHATFFITSGQFSGPPIWNERILHSVGHATDSTEPLSMSIPGLSPLRFHDHAARIQSVKILDENLKYQSPEIKETLLQQLESHTGLFKSQTPAMTIQDLRHLHSRGFSVGAHSVTHPILTACTPARAYQEIAGAREEIEAIIGGKVTAFAYPNGSPGKDFDSGHIDMVKRSGYNWALTTMYGTATAATSPFQIPRFTPWGPTIGRMELQFTRNLFRRNLLLKESNLKGKRALMVAFHFPPQTGSSGILRSLNFVKYLPASGWHSTVLTASPNAYVQQRNDLVSSIPAETVLVRAAAFDAARHLAIKGKYLRLSALPDRWASWCFPAVLAGLREIRRDRPNIIWSTYPIATAHLIGGALARLTGIPWVADFRDPMVGASYPEDQMQRKIAEWLEPRVMKRSAACVFTTDRAAQNYKQKYPEFAYKCKVIENGYDDEAFEAADIMALPPKSDEILMLHSGAIYPSDRDPSSFFDAVRTLIDNGEIDSTKLSIRFRAPGHGDDVMVCAERYGVGSLVQLAPPIPYHEAIVEMMSANLLLVFQGKNFNSQVPAKIYEYVRSKRPILAITDPEGETFRQLQQFNCIWQADIASVSSVSKAMLSWINAGRTPESESLLMQNLEIVRRYSRKAGAERLGELFHSIHKRTDRAD